MKTALLVLVLGLGLGAPAGEAADPRGFQTPSGNVHCLYESSARLRCDILRIDREPRRPASCEYDYGHGFAVPRSGKGRRLCISDTVANPSNRRLAYGSTWRRGRFTCRSTRAKLRCTNRGGHGIELSRSRQKVF